MPITVSYTGAGVTLSTPSPSIWDNFDFAASAQLRDVREFWDDFNSLGTTGLPWLMDESDATGSVALVADEENGFLRIACTTTDNIEAWVHAGSDAGTMVDINLGNGDVGYEARVRTSNVGDDTGAIGLGLVEDALAVGDNVFQADDTGILASKSVVGFNTVHVNGGDAGTNAVLRSIYGTNGTTATVLQSGVQTLVADTWYKFGFFFDSKTGVIKFYVDGVAQSSTVLESATNFPDGVGLVPFFCNKVGSAATCNFDIDWVRVAQRRAS